MAFETTIKAVRIVDDVEIIRILVDPVRGEILRQVAEHPMTEAQLAKKLNLVKSSVGYHLQVLIKAGLIRVERTEVEHHGIQQKFYESTSKLFLVNVDSVPIELQRYFLNVHLERLRGVLSVLQLMETKRGHAIEISRDQLESLSLEIARQISIIGKRYEERGVDVNRETLLIKIYGETLEKIVAEHRWAPLNVLETL